MGLLDSLYPIKAPTTEEKYLAQRRMRGLSDMAFGAADLLNQGINLGIQDVGALTGLYSPSKAYQLPMPSQSAADLAAKWSGADVVPDAAVSPEAQQKGANQRALIGMIPTGVEDLAGPMLAAVPAIARSMKGAKGVLGEVADAAKGVRAGGVLSDVAKAADDVPPIRAYHGSPHNFDKFDMSKIGTGEGAQAYGHGLYFAENEGVAKSYRDNLSRPSFNETAAGTPISPSLSRLLEDSYNDLLGGPGSMSSAIHKDAVRWADQKLDQQINDARAAGDFEWFNKALDQKREVQRLYNDPLGGGGHMYQVNINANPDHFLDWDKPLHRQPESIQEALGWTKPLREEYDATSRQVDDALLGSLLHNADPSAIDALSRRADEISRQVGIRRDATGADIVKGNSIFDSASDAVKSRELAAKGIPGIKYLDASSRSAGEGSRNYVVFDPKLIEIVRRYGLAAAVASGVVSAEMAQQMREQGAS